MTVLAANDPAAATAAAGQFAVLERTVGWWRRSLRRALLLAIGIVVVAAAACYGGAVWLTEDGWLAESTWRFVAKGCVAAVLAVGLALRLHGRFLDRDLQQLDPRQAAAPKSMSSGQVARLAAGRLQGLLAAAFGIKLVALVLAVLVLRATGVKFSDLAAFCIAFAAASLLSQVAAASYLARLLSRSRAPSRVLSAAVDDAAAAS